MDAGLATIIAAAIAAVASIIVAWISTSDRFVIFRGFSGTLKKGAWMVARLLLYAISLIFLFAVCNMLLTDVFVHGMSWEGEDVRMEVYMLIVALGLLGISIFVAIRTRRRRRRNG